LVEKIEEQSGQKPTLVQIRIWNCEEEKAEHLIA
jgi:hypothetical protein